MKKMPPRSAIHALRGALVICVCAVGLSPSGCFAWFGDAEGYCAEMASVYCANAFRCCTGRELEALMGEEHARDEGRCRKDMELSCRDYYATRIYAVDKGTVEFQRDVASACLEAMRAPDGECVSLVAEAPYQEACEENPWAGTQGDGAACVWDFECVEDAFCDGVNCRSLPRQGEACPNQVCAAGLYCGFDSGEMVCLAPRSEGEDCSGSSECQEQLYCDGTCRAQLGGGATCHDHLECTSYECSAGSCGDGRYCTGDWDCDNACELSGDFCWSDSDCPGSCSTSGGVCNNGSECPNGESCINESCAPGSCAGRVCASEDLIVLDYCWLSP